VRDAIAVHIADMLKVNHSVTNLNLETNRIAGMPLGIVVSLSLLL
jgi:hypothetical protein